METKLSFPNKINNPKMYRGYYLDQILVSVFAIGFAFMVTTLTIGGLHTAIASIYSGIISWVVYGYMKKKMNRGYIWHWFWTRGQITMKPKSRNLDNLPKDFLPKGYECEFRD